MAVYEPKAWITCVAKGKSKCHNNTKGAQRAHMAPVNKLKEIICFGEYAFCSMRLTLNGFN